MKMSSIITESILYKNVSFGGTNLSANSAMLDSFDTNNNLSSLVLATSNETLLNANLSMAEDEDEKRDFVFDRTDVRVIFITLYSMVFCCCFFGKFFSLPFWILHDFTQLYYL